MSLLLVGAVHVFICARIDCSGGNGRDCRTAAVLFRFTTRSKANQVEPWATCSRRTVADRLRKSSSRSYHRICHSALIPKTIAACHDSNSMKDEVCGALTEVVPSKTEIQSRLLAPIAPNTAPQRRSDAFAGHTATYSG